MGWKLYLLYVRYAFTLAILALCSSSALSQGWIWTAEGGINTSEFGEHTDYSDFKPQVSPVIGMHWRYRGAESSVYFDTGVRYNIVGHKFTFQSTTYGGTTAWQRYDGVEHYKFHKIAFGGGVGFYLGEKEKLFTGIGFRMNYYPAGSYFAQTILTEQGTPPQQVYYADYDPMNNPDLAKQASKIGFEFYYTAGLAVHPRVRIELQFCFPKSITFEQFNLAGYTQMWMYLTNDLSLSAFFALRKPSPKPE